MFRYYDPSSADAKTFNAAKTMDDQCAASDRDGGKSGATTTQKGTCNICGGSGRVMGLQCKHLFCPDCWRSYIKCKVGPF